MVFHLRALDGHEASTADCRSIADAYGLWENTGFLVGYFLLRSEDSQFTRANVFGIGVPPRASFIDQPFSRDGFIPDLAFDMLPTSMAPIIRWSTSERGPATGRTYAVGLTEAANDTESDKEKVNGLYLDALATIFGNLNAAIGAPLGYQLAHYTDSPRGGTGPGGKLLDITGCGVYERMGSQRRRTRP